MLQQEGVGCKDWLTNKVDRSVTGRVARQQCQGPLQLPLRTGGAMAVDFRGRSGMATSIARPSRRAGRPRSRLAAGDRRGADQYRLCPPDLRAEGVSLSANWMWPCRNPGEDVVSTTP